VVCESVGVRFVYTCCIVCVRVCWACVYEVSRHCLIEFNATMQVKNTCSLKENVLTHIDSL